MSMQDKVVLITGAAQGIGQGIALKFAEEGAQIAIFDVIEPKQTIKKIQDIGGQVFWQNVNITDENLVKESIDAIISKWNKIDILVNNAGIFPIEHFHELSVALFRKIFDINVVGTFICSKYIVQHFISKNIKGIIINIASVGGIREELYNSHYNASKAAVISLSKSMAFELGKYGIRVNAIAPGAISTRGARTATPFQESGKIPPEFLEYQTRKRSPLIAMGDPEDIANMALFISSNQSRYITGAVITIDGGRSLL